MIDDSASGQVSTTVNAVIAALLVLCFGPLGACAAWWLLGGVGFVGSLLRALAFCILYAFSYGLLFIATLLLGAYAPLFALSAIPLGIGLYLVLEIVLVVSVVKSVLIAAEDRHE